MALLFLRYAMWLAVALLALDPSSRAAAQYFQNFMAVRILDPTTNPPTFYDGYKYRPTPDNTAVYRNVIDTRKQRITIYYNCHYMTNICQNVNNFKATTRGRDLHPGTAIPAGMYTYDFDSGEADDDDPETRQFYRRQASCPKTWKNSHTCPEPVGQQTLWRHDGPWSSTALEPGTKNNTLKHERNAQGQITRYSQLRYSCDEFPPATWVEGGNGWDRTTPASTFCAGLSCKAAGSNTAGVAVKAEQNWQGEAHGKLRALLLSHIEKRKSEFPWHNKDEPQHDVAFFDFAAFDMGPDGYAATIFRSDDVLKLETDFSFVSQAKREETPANNPDEPARTPRLLPGRTNLTAEQTYQRLLAGHGFRIGIPAHINGSAVAQQSLLGGLGGIEMRAAGSSADLSGRATTPRPNSAGARTPKTAPKRQVTSSWNSTDGKPLLKTASAADLARARSIVADAIAASAKLNKARLANPARNQYRLKPGTVIGGSVATAPNNNNNNTRRDQSGDDNDAPPTPLLVITEEIAWAAALVAEAEAAAPSGGVNSGTTHSNPSNSSSSGVKRRAPVRGTYWMETIARRGTVPWGDDPTYKVFRNVLDYGATGNGVTDDTAAIKEALNDGRRCGEKCNGSTIKNAIVYFPPGTYLVSSTIPLPFGTQVIGDVLDRPLIIASSSFTGLGVLSTDEYTGGGTGPDGGDQQWYVNTANFYRQIRNVIIDVRDAPATENTACLHYQVAQATSLQNVELRAGPGSMGMYAENGSGGQISDVVFSGGDVGLYGGAQQFTAQRLRFDGCDTAVHLFWDWGWVWKSVTMTNVNVGFRFVVKDPSGSVGSAAVLDSSFTNVGAAVLVSPPSADVASRSTGLVLENVAVSSVTAVVADTSGTTHLSGAGQSLVDHWVLGPVYNGSVSARSFSMGGKVGRYRRDGGLVDSSGNYFERPKPQYEDRAVGDFVHIKDFGAVGDGVTDDTAAVQSALYSSQGKILFVDAGSYILTDTVVVPTNVKIVGETWSQFVAFGSAFSDANNPKVMVRVGTTPGQVGNVEMQDLFFTTKGPTAGAVLVEWNMAADAKGSAALWDCHVRIGGATGTDLTPAECPPLTSGIAPGCNAASLMMHLKPGASGYFENMWLWVADHMIDDPDLGDANNTMVQNSVYAARGFLIESTAPVWLYATASEHAVYYQYNFHNASTIFTSMIQTESPYYQPTPPPPAPFADVVGKFPGDPDYTCAPGEFNGCDESWGVIMRGCEDILITSAGLYSWFSTYAQDCIDGQACQKAMMLLQGNHASVRIQNLVTIGTKYMAVMEGQGILAADNLNVDAHPFWSQISILDVASDGAQFNDIIWVHPDIWNMDEPEFSCAPPCRVKLPPYTGATSVVNFPLMTVSKDAWTSTITVPPMTLSKLGFEIMTLDEGGGGGLKRRTAFGTVWPVPATTSNWPAVIYRGPDGETSTASPTGAFPTPPPSIGPGAAPPQMGAWPAQPLVVRAAAVDPNADIDEKAKEWLCRQAASNPSYWDSDLVKDCPGYFGPGLGEIPLGPGGNGFGWGWGWDVPEITGNGTSYGELELCDLPETSTTTTSATPTRTTAPSTPTPTKNRADPNKNTIHCFNSGQKMSNIRLQNGRNSACNNLAMQAGVSGRKRGTGEIEGPFLVDSRLPFSGSEEIHWTFEVKEGCVWTFDFDECLHYLKTPVDSCDCGGENGKQGGYGSNNCLSWMFDPNKSW
ncbi:pectate lyase superfamily protein-domain-containing protein [Chaetomium tenue]|uniref:Pectate lyase superfamily protein-domain-containing protein n=1 Tax=Chaetomium tenue TaxID=1854479 RepID=A0ACB7PLL8_9PEZI|nr:pectate lyase superfamily protein-domain-containing protein [Chaetomium globosum]